ncbi:response regulator [Flavisolibacter tropicus]|nr:response regulator transcription factor [Flavisolibacter tropicus]
MKQQIRVLLADDHPMFLDGVRNALSAFEDIELVALCTDGDAVLDSVKKVPVDVAVLDINMPLQNGIALAKIIRNEYSHIKVVFLTMYHPSTLGNEGINNFALGYVLKNSGSQVLYAAIQSAFKGQRYTDPKLKDVLPNEKHEVFPDAIKLSQREKEIIKLIIEGKGSKEIADLLFLSELTISTHRKNINRKLGVSNLATLMIRVRGLDLD